MHRRPQFHFAFILLLVLAPVAVYSYGNYETRTVEQQRALRMKAYYNYDGRSDHVYVRDLRQRDDNEIVEGEGYRSSRYTTHANYDMMVHSKVESRI